MPWFQPMKVPAEGPQTRPSAIPRVAKKVSPWRRRGEGGAGGEEVERGGHTREPQLAVAATCRRVPREPRDPACPLFFPPLVSSLTALLRLLCRTEIVIYVRTTFPSFSSENRTDLSLRFFVFFLFLSKRASNGIFRNFRSWIRAVCNLLNRLCSPRCAKMQ